MAQTTVYTCDICKQSKCKNDLSRIEVSTTGIRIRNHNGYTALKIDICRECLERKGFIVDVTGAEMELVERKNKETLEDKICDILEDLGVSFVG